MRHPVSVLTAATSAADIVSLAAIAAVASDPDSEPEFGRMESGDRSLALQVDDSGTEDY
jgi:hypothetical protein